MVLGFYPALVADVGISVGWGATVGAVAARWSDEAVGRDGPMTRLRQWERGGGVYARIGVRRWKGHLPDAATVFGGRPKRLGARTEESWLALAGETRRAERAHWWMLLALAPEAALRGGVLLAIIGSIAVVLNVPCIAAQRHNRGRLLALCERRRRRDAYTRSGDASRSTPSQRSTDRRSAVWSSSGVSTPR